MSLMKVLMGIAVFSVWVALAVGLVQWYRGGKMLVRMVVVYLAFITMVEGVAFYFAYSNINNLWLSHLYIPIEYTIFCLIFYFTFDNKLIKRGLLLSIVVFVLFCIVDILYIESILQINSYPRTAESALLISISLMYFYKVFNELDKLHLERDPIFLLSAGLIIYFAGITAVYGFLNLMLEQSVELSRNFYTIVYFFNIFLSCQLGLVLWRAPRQ